MDSMYMHSQYMPYTPHHNMAPYAGAPPRASRSKLSDNIITDANGAFSNPDITLQMRQQPQEALVMSAGKEKGRKPVDPPAIVQLKVNEDVEASQHFLQSPHLFMVVDLWKADKDERWDDRGSQSGSSLYGGLSSSLTRLKDVDNKEGGFFIFGDISVKVTGNFRLQFRLYDLQKEQNAAIFLGSVLSQPFKVVASKDFQGLAESTYMSRAFADQGVRLRLRKEPRTFAGQKRGYYEEDSPQQKRYRADTEDRNAAPLPQTSGHTASHTPSLQADYTSSHTAAPQPEYTSPHTSGLQPDYTTPTYTSGLQPHYTSSYTRLPQPNYASQYLQPSSSPYYPARPSIETRSYPVEQYPSNLNLGSIPPLSIPQSDMSQSNVQYPDMRTEGGWNVSEVPAEWHTQPSSAS